MFIFIFHLFLICLVPTSKNNSPDLVDNNLVTPSYDFDNPSDQAEEESEEDCDLLELARLLKQEEKVIQPLEGELRLLFQVPSRSGRKNWGRFRGKPKAGW